MARNDISNPLGVIDIKSATRAGSDARSTAANVTSNAWSVSTLRARLKVISAATYTDAVLDKMTKNDMLYALRMSDDAANIK